MSKTRSAFRDDVHVHESFNIRMRKPGGEDDQWRGGGEGDGAPPIKVFSNVNLRLRDPKSNRIVDEREDHNIFLNYGRDWLAQLIGLDTGGAPFRGDRVKLVAFGVGGTAQLVPSADIRLKYPGFPNDWAGGAGTGNPTQTQVNPDVTALEWPVEVAVGDYYDLISQPNTFPGSTGVIRFTSVLGLTEINFGAYTSVPLSEIGLFTEGVTDESIPPVVSAGLPAEKYMVAYHTFDTLSKTTSFVLEVDWEIRFS